MIQRFQSRLFLAGAIIGGLLLLGAGSAYAANTTKIIGGSPVSTSDPLATSAQGLAASGAASSGNPVLIGGSNGTNTYTAAADVNGHLILRGPAAMFNVTATPAANTQATASRAAAAAGVAHCATSVNAALVAGTTAPTAATATLNLRDGATGAGTVLWSETLGISATAGSGQHVQATFPAPLCGTAATAMTLEFSAASGLNTLQSVALTGFDN